MLYANVAVLCCVLVLRQPLYSRLIFSLMVVVGAWVAIVSFYQLNWLPLWAIINYYSYLILESTIYFFPSYFAKYSYRLRSALAVLLPSYKSKDICNKLKFQMLNFSLAPASQTAESSRSVIHSLLPVCIRTAIYPGMRYLLSTCFMPGYVLVIGDKSEQYGLVGSQNTKNV